MKSQVTNISKMTTTKADDSFGFLKNKNFFAEKHARAKKILKKMKLPKELS